jgi:hypothetical protein
MRSQLHPLVVKTLQRLLSAGGKVDIVADWAALQELQRLACLTTDPPEEKNLLFLDLPVVIGNCSLYRLSWGALDWLREYAFVWWEGTRMEDRALVWAHAHARQPEAFQRCAEERAAFAEIRRWSRTLSAPVAQLVAGTQTLSQSAPRSDGSGESVPAGAAINSLMEAYHQPADYFVWGISSDALGALLRNRAHAVRRQESMLDGASGRAPDPDAPDSKAAIAYQRAAKVFTDAHLNRDQQTTERQGGK